MNNQASHRAAEGNDSFRTTPCQGHRASINCTERMNARTTLSTRIHILSERRQALLRLSQSSNSRQQVKGTSRKDLGLRRHIFSKAATRTSNGSSIINN
ncbi:hypothetical protein DL546_004480, partial [Coniochaeta pulveracea]